MRICPASKNLLLQGCGNESKEKLKNGVVRMPNVVGSIENEALENEDRSTKHPNLETNDNTLFWEITFREFPVFGCF